MSGLVAGGLRARLSTALLEAMRAGNRPAVSVLRSALARVANAEAVPVDGLPAAGAFEQARVGVGAADVTRRELTEDDVRALVEAEVAEHEQAASERRALGRDADAATLVAGADVLRALLAGSPPDSR